LKNPFLDNAHARSWSASASGGTPGSKNDVFEEVEGDCGSAWMRFLRGDSNTDGRVDISDPIDTLRFLFLDQRQVSCLDAHDTNDDGSVDILDAMATIFHLFTGTVDIPPPGPGTCGVDPTDDELSCGFHPPCQ
jgi:hypothetical protein